MNIFLFYPPPLEFHEMGANVEKSKVLKGTVIRISKTKKRRGKNPITLGTGREYLEERGTNSGQLENKHIIICSVVVVSP